MDSEYGFVKVPRDINKAIPDIKTPSHQPVADLPESGFTKYLLEYATQELPEQVLNHSLRVYLYSIAIIIDHFPDWDLGNELLLTTCLLHDIGTTTKNMDATKMSFEFYGGLLARDLIIKKLGNLRYAEAACEAIIRHQDIGVTGYITSLGLILQIATILDNVALHTDLIHEETLDAINKQYPRKGWTSCFAQVIDNENTQKPWCHTSALTDKFRTGVLTNYHQYERK